MCLRAWAWEGFAARETFDESGAAGFEEGVDIEHRSILFRDLGSRRLEMRSRGDGELEPKIVTRNLKVSITEKFNCTEEEIKRC